MIEILHAKHFRVCYVEGNVRVYLNDKSVDIGFQYPATMTDLLDLADKMHDASTLLRSIVEESDPGKVFELNQALQFGAHKLEGDL